MTINEMMGQFVIQGAFCIRHWNWEEEDYTTLAHGDDFDCDNYDISDDILDRRITYMYVVDGVLNFEVE